MIVRRCLLIALLFLSLSACGLGLPLGDYSRPAQTPGLTEEATDLREDRDSAGEERGSRAPGAVRVLRSRTPLTRATRAAARAFRADVARALTQERLLHLTDLRRAGYRRVGLDGIRWSKPEHLTDGIQFDPARPEFLVVAGERTVGVIFSPESMRLNAPEPPGAPLMRWNYHRYAPGEVCVTSMLTLYAADDRGCRDGDRMTTRSPLMTHVWILDTGRPFAATLKEPT